MDVDWVELTAFKESMKVAGGLTISKAVYEYDCANLVYRMKKRGMTLLFWVNVLIKHVRI